jgi:hypothetical protein
MDIQLQSYSTVLWYSINGFPPQIYGRWELNLSTANMHQLNTVPMPPQKQRQGQRKISYNDMVLEAHEAPVIKCAIAALSNWVFLAGFVVFPGTFTSLGRATLLGESQAGRAVQQVIRNTPLLVIGILCCLAGGAGIGWTSWSFRSNYVWLVDRILM